MTLSLPIDDSLDRIVECVRSSPMTIVHAPPGSGKTTRVAPALLQRMSIAAGRRVYLLQPRRLAARSVAVRIADENRWELGREVGYHVRFERRYQRDTRLIVATEGVLLRRLQSDAALDDVEVVLLDEFHERSLDADLVLGMLREIQATIRPDLKCIVMSATLDRESLAKQFPEAPTIAVDGRMYPVAIRYRAPRFQQSMVESMASSLDDVLDRHSGDILAFLPGQGEIHRVRDRLVHERAFENIDILPLYGSLPLNEQTRIIQPGERRKIVLATNVAETSLTIEGIRVVVDSGQARVMRFEPSVGLDRLNLEPITQDSATQRTGRAGRVAEGTCYRLWDEASHRSRPLHLDPEVRRVDLAAAILTLFQWGQTAPLQFAWLTPPREESVEAAIRLLERLHAIRKNKLTELGKQIARLPLHPRLARMVLEGNAQGQLPSVALAAAMLADRDPFRSDDHRDRSSGTHRSSLPTSQNRRWTSDVVVRVELLEQYLRTGESQTILGRLHRSSVQPIEQSAREIESQVAPSREIETAINTAVEEPSRLDASNSLRSSHEVLSPEESIMRSLLAGFPDRLAKRRSIGKNSALMVGGRAVQVAASSGVHEAELFLCIDVDGRGNDCVVRQASTVQLDWLNGDALQERDELFFHPTQQQVVARRRLYWDDLLLSETPVAIDDRDQAAELLYRAAIPSWDAVFPKEDAALTSLVQRSRWLRSVVPEIDLPDVSEAFLQEVCRSLCDHHRSFHELKKAPWYDWVVSRFTDAQKKLLDREAPEKLQVPSGSQIRLDYEVGKPPVLAVKIQEIFSWKHTPRLAMGRVAVLLHLLAPNMRPQQITEDLASFWATGYDIVKKDLKRRYPKHAWPDDPTTAVASKR